MNIRALKADTPTLASSCI